jgi:hypothetical protein
MKKTIIILVCALATPASAKEKCTSMCHFFDAWALTKLCKNLALNEDGVKDDKVFGDMRSLKRQALKDMRKVSAACHPDCKWDAEAPDIEGTPCQYLKEVK